MFHDAGLDILITARGARCIIIPRKLNSRSKKILNQIENMINGVLFDIIVDAARSGCGAVHWLTSSTSREWKHAYGNDALCIVKLGIVSCMYGYIEEEDRVEIHVRTFYCQGFILRGFWHTMVFQTQILLCVRTL